MTTHWHADSPTFEHPMKVATKVVDTTLEVQISTCILAARLLAVALVGPRYRGTNPHMEAAQASANLTLSTQAACVVSFSAVQEYTARTYEIVYRDECIVFIGRLALLAGKQHQVAMSPRGRSFSASPPSFLSTAGPEHSRRPSALPAVPDSPRLAAALGTSFLLSGGSWILSLHARHEVSCAAVMKLVTSIMRIMLEHRILW